MLKQAKDIERGDIIISQSGHSYTVALIQLLPTEGQVAFYDEALMRHGPYLLDEYLEVLPKK
jgi:hypothetical protein